MTEEELQRELEEQLRSSEKAAEKMLMYYASSLQSMGVKDVRQYMANKLCKLIDLTDEQASFVMLNINKENKIYDNLINSCELLKGMKKNKQLDMESIDIILNVLNLMIQDLKPFIFIQEESEQ